MRTTQEAREALSEALEGVDNPVAASKALGRVVRRFEPEAETSVDALRHIATEALTPHLNGNAKAVAWAIVDGVRSGGGRPPPGREDTGFGMDGPAVLSLADVLADPEALKPPEAVVPRFAYKGRTLLYAAREKLGKSTTARAGAAAVTTGRPFLGGRAVKGRVLYLALEEHLSDVARSFQEFEADPDRVFILDRVAEPFTDLEGAVSQVDPVLVVVDTLAAFTESLGLDPGSSSDWTPVMARLSRIARDTDVALQLLHHGTKRDGKYRDSTAIGAGVDAILEMSEGMESSLRKIRARARWQMEDFGFRLVQGEDRPRFEVSSGELSLDARVMMYLERNPGTSTRDVRENVEGKTVEISTTLNRLDRDGYVENRGAGNRHEWFLSENAGTASGTATGSRQNPQGTGTEPEPGTATVPAEQPLEPHDGNRSEDDLQSDLAAYLED